MTPGMQKVFGLLFGKRFSLEDEKRTQAEIAAIFAAELDLDWAREVPIAGGVIDFVIDGDTGVEIKLRARELEVRRQMLRYAREPSLNGFVLVTSKPVALGSELMGKPAAVLDLGRAWL